MNKGALKDPDSLMGWLVRAERAEARVKKLEGYMEGYKHITNEIVEIYNTSGGIECGVEYRLTPEAYDVLIELKQEIGE